MKKQILLNSTGSILLGVLFFNSYLSGYSNSGGTFKYLDPGYGFFPEFIKSQNIYSKNLNYAAGDSSV